MTIIFLHFLEMSGRSVKKFIILNFRIGEEIRLLYQAFDFKLPYLIAMGCVAAQPILVKELV